MSSGLVKILAIAMLSVFLAGCSDNDSNKSAEDYKEKSIDDYSKAAADIEYTKQQFNQGNYINAAEGVFHAAKNFVSSTVNEILGYIAKSKGSFILDQRNITVKKGIRGIEDIAKLFADKSKSKAIDYYSGGEYVPLGQMVLRYSSVEAEPNVNPLRQRLVATIQLHESDNKHGQAQLSLLCNGDKTVDFGIGQVNTRSWLDGSCKGMADKDIVNTATKICAEYRLNPNDFKCRYGKIINGKCELNVNAYIVELLVRSYGGEVNLVRNPTSPFNPILNARCTYRHLNEDFKTATRLFPNCKSLEAVGRFRCTGNLDSDYTAVALMAYGGLKKEWLINNARLRSGDTVIQTFDDYMAEFRSAYAALYKEPPPF